jgi:hypothetical protein
VSERGNWTTTSAQNVVATITMRLSHRPAHFAGGWWGFLDALGHRLRLPSRVMRPICDHFDIAVGIPKEDVVRMDYDGKAPWWLR